MINKSPAKILIVDDEPDLCEISQEILMYKYQEVDIAGDGLQALNMMQQKKYDLLLVDFNMPKMSGQELVKTIRESGNQSTSLIMLTGHGSFKDAQELLNDYGINDFLNKPVESARLLFSINRALYEQGIERELIKHREHLETLVGERTFDLQVAYEKAEQANMAKSEFISSMSHELRTPLNAILGFGQILEMENEGLDESQMSSVTEIMLASHHLLQLINELLDLATIESGNMEVSLEEVFVFDLIPSCIALVHPQAESRKVKIVDHVSGNKYSVKADFTRLKQVLVNILSNAVKYNRDCGEVALESKVIDEQMLRISIVDTGEGMHQEDLAFIFEPFGRLGEINTIEGTGIGLTITKKLIELMGGRIGVESMLGEGSTFWLELPLLQNPNAQANHHV